MKRNFGQRRPSGETRESQLLSTFGPGSLTDLPDYSAIIGGLDHWLGDKPLVTEERLLAKVRQHLESPHAELRSPPVVLDSEKGSGNGVVAWRFPEWFVSTYEEEFAGFRARPLVHLKSLRKGKYSAPDKSLHNVVPIRFVRACAQGHIDDVDWVAFVHSVTKGNESPCKGPLWLSERGTSGDFSEIFASCQACRKSRQLSAAKEFKADMPALGWCNGRMPWLGPGDYPKCQGPNGKAEHFRLLVRHASNAYFPLRLSVIHIPDHDQVLKNAVAEVYDDFLSTAENQADIKHERKKAKVSAALANFSDAAVWQEVQRRKGLVTTQTKSVKQAEVETLLAAPPETGEDIPYSAFHARKMEWPDAPTGALTKVQSVVLVHRLRQVTAQIGFTRFEPTTAGIDGELALNVRRAPLSREPRWAPAVENQGEGIFISFRTEDLEAWEKQPGVQKRQQQLAKAFEAWRSAKELPDSFKFVGVRYVMLHSLSHLLLTAVALECGYSSSAITERVYATAGGYGILLFTGTPDSEGTLGGLVAVGRNLDRHLDIALEMGTLCSNDPVCAAHEPLNDKEKRHLHGAACHGCLLISETSCEQMNQFLDRALVVPTVDCPDAAFFPVPG